MQIPRFGQVNSQSIGFETGRFTLEDKLHGEGDIQGLGKYRAHTQIGKAAPLVTSFDFDSGQRLFVYHRYGDSVVFRGPDRLKNTPEEKALVEDAIEMKTAYLQSKPKFRKYFKP